MIVLGIETSCDETAVALYSQSSGLIDHKVYSQAKLHARYGGVVPELASRDHISKLLPLFKALIKKNNISDSEMLSTFNCGVGFCLIVEKQKVNKVKKFFEKKFQPYEVGFVSKSSKKIKLLNKLKW